MHKIWKSQVRAPISGKALVSPFILRNRDSQFLKAARVRKATRAKCRDESEEIRTNRAPNVLSRSTTDLSRARSLRHILLSVFPPVLFIVFPLSFPRLLYPVSPSRSTRSSSRFFSLSPSLSLALSLFFAPNVVSWGQCLLDRILSRNIPADEEEEEKDDLFPSEPATVATRARARTSSFENRFRCAPLFAPRDRVRGDRDVTM